MSDFEQANSLFVGARERAFAMTEQLALDQAFGQRSAIHGDIGHVTAQALVMDGTSDEFLAGAGVSQNQDGRMRRSDFRDQLSHLFHRRAFAHQFGPSLRSVPVGA